MNQDNIKCSIKENRSEKNKENIQSHPANLSTTVIPRTFRWTLTNENHPNIHWWMKSIKTYYAKKRIVIEAYDDAEGSIFNWLQDLMTKDVKLVTLTHLDSCGTPIFLINFFGLKLDGHVTTYNYNSSDILTHKIAISYNKLGRVNKLNVQ